MARWKIIIYTIRIKKIKIQGYEMVNLMIKLIIK